MPRGIYDRTRFKKNKQEVQTDPTTRVSAIVASGESTTPSLEAIEFKPPKPYETFMQSLCIHGVYKPLCKRCEQL